MAMGFELPNNWYRKKPHNKTEARISARTGFAIAMAYEDRKDAIVGIFERGLSPAASCRSCVFNWQPSMG